MQRVEQFLKRKWLELLIFGLLRAFLSTGVRVLVYPSACRDGEPVRVEVLGVNFAPWNEVRVVVSGTPAAQAASLMEFL